MFVAACQSLALEVRRPRDSRQRQIERLRSLLSPGGAFSYMSSFSNAVRLPQQPSVLAYGIMPEESTVLNSANFPLKLILRVSGGAQMPVIVKTHHDLRRDKLVLNAISVMNSQLLAAGLDLKLKTYSVCPASPQCGFVEFVPSLPMSKVLADYNNDIRVFFAASSPSSLHPSGIDPDVLDTFLRSCAGYCVVSYLLGIGDRHLDNLMLTAQGHLFHIDFEYILGNDPKPFAPPMKLCEQMVVAMGGRTSKEYIKFQRLACRAFLILRQHAAIVVNMFDLVAQDIFDSTSTHGAAPRLLERFQLNLSDNDAVVHMQQVIEDSLAAFFPVVVDTLHKWRQFFKA